MPDSLELAAVPRQALHELVERAGQAATQTQCQTQGAQWCEDEELATLRVWIVEH